MPEKLETAELAVDTTNGNLYTKLDDGSVVHLNDAGEGGDGTGSSVHIGEAPPAGPQEGQQWMEVPANGDATMWIYDGDKWLQQPGGKDGAPGQNGADGNIQDATEQGVIATWDDKNKQWTPEGAVVVDANASVTVREDIANPHSGTIDADSNMSGLRIWNNAETTSLSSGVWFKTGGHWSGIAGSRNENGGWGTQLSFYTHEDAIQNLSQATERMIIDANGNVGVGVTPGTTSGLNVYANSNISWNESSGGSLANIYRQASSGALVLAQGYKQTDTPNGFASSMAGHFPKSAITIANGINFYVDNYTDWGVGTDITPTKRMSIDYNGRVDIYGSLYVNGTPKIGTVDLIKAFSKLRDAVKDEETVESLKESITNCIGGLIEEWEAMQSPATQEIEQ